MTPSMVRVAIAKILQGGQGERCEGSLAVEGPLEIRVGGKNISVTMRTPGNDFELAAGFLLSEGIVSRPGQIAGIARMSDGTPTSWSSLCRPTRAPNRSLCKGRSS